MISSTRPTCQGPGSSPASTTVPASHRRPMSPARRAASPAPHVTRCRWRTEAPVPAVRRSRPRTLSHPTSRSCSRCGPPTTATCRCSTWWCPTRRPTPDGTPPLTDTFEFMTFLGAGIQPAAMQPRVTVEVYYTDLGWQPFTPTSPPVPPQPGWENIIGVRATIAELLRPPRRSTCASACSCAMASIQPTSHRSRTATP